MNPKPYFDLILNRSESSTSLQTLYRGYHYFEMHFGTDFGVIAYAETRTAWVGASEPVLTNPDFMAPLLEGFAEAAKKDGKKACLLPVSEKTAHAAKGLGFYAVQTGKEPWYKVGGTLSSSISNAKQLLGRGAVVESFDPTRITVGQRWELDDLTDRWLESRKMANLGFLNRVEPWSLLKQKKYFRAIYHGRQIGYLAAVPIIAKNSWYFVDLIRAPDSPVGTTEILIAESARLLQECGASEFTLGMSPFAPVTDEERRTNPVAFGLFGHIYNGNSALYGFKSLQQFKQKFRPERWEPNYYICFGHPLNPKVLYGIFSAIFPQGILHTVGSTLHKVFRHTTFEKLYARVLNEKIVPKPPPTSWFQYITNARVVFFLTLVNTVAFYATTTLDYKLRPVFAHRYAYSWTNFYTIHPFPYGFLNLIIASFVHWDIFHLLFNVLFTLVFMSFLECVMGGSLMIVAYFSGILFSNPLTSLVVFPAIDFFAKAKLPAFVVEKDVGCSLGVFACLGFLMYLVKNGKIVFGLCTLSVIAYAIHTDTYLVLSHITALVIGLGFAKLYAKV